MSGGAPLQPPRENMSRSLLGILHVAYHENTAAALDVRLDEGELLAEVGPWSVAYAPPGAPWRITRWGNLCLCAVLFASCLPLVLAGVVAIWSDRGVRGDTHDSNRLDRAA